jgi:streptogramin lyase
VSRRRARAWAVLAAALLASGCGAPSSHGAALPSAAAPDGAKQTLTITVAVPGRGTSHGARKPAYVSRATVSMSVVVTPDGGPAAPPAIVNCGAVCSEDVAVAPGRVTIAVSLYDDIFARGDVLSTGSTTTTVAKGQTNAVKLTFDPVVADISVNVSSRFFQTSNQLVIGQPVTFANVFTAFDAAGFSIVGPGNFVDASGAPVTFAFNGGDPHVHFTVSSLSAPGNVPLAYDGHGAFGSLGVTGGALSRTFSYLTVLPPELQNAAHTLFPLDLAIGGDGNVWFTEVGVGSIFRRNPDGSISQFALPAHGNVNAGLGRGLVRTADGALWVAWGANYVRVDQTGAMTAYPIPPALTFYNVSSSTLNGSGGITFATDNRQLANVAPNGTVTQVTVPGSSGFSFSSLMLGSDNRVWFLDDGFAGTTLVAYATTSGTFSRYTPPALPGRVIFPGPDGKVWSVAGTSLERFDTATGSGTSSTLTVPAWTSGIGVNATVTDGAGNVYFADSGDSAIGRIDAALHVVEYPVYPGSLFPTGIARTSAGTLFYGDSGTFGGNGANGGGLGSVDPALF